MELASIMPSEMSGKDKYDFTQYMEYKKPNKRSKGKREINQETNSTAENKLMVTRTRRVEGWVK